MLSDGDFNLFYKLLDSLSESLRDLAAKFALLSRDAEDRRSIADAVAKLYSSIDKIDRDFREAIHNSEGKIEDLNDLIQPLIVEIRKINEAVTIMHLETGRIDTSLGPNATKMNDINTKLDTKLESIKNVSVNITDLKNELAPLIKIASYIHKPIAWILVGYTILATLAGFMKVTEWVGTKWGSKPPAIEQSATHGLQDKNALPTNTESEVKNQRR